MVEQNVLAAIRRDPDAEVAQRRDIVVFNGIRAESPRKEDMHKQGFNGDSLEGVGSVPDRIVRNEACLIYVKMAGSV